MQWHLWQAIRNKIQITYGNHVSLQGHHDVTIRQKQKTNKQKKIKKKKKTGPSPNLLYCSAMDNENLACLVTLLAYMVTISNSNFVTNGVP